MALASLSCTGVDPAPQSQFLLGRAMDDGRVEVIMVECGTRRRLTGIAATVDGRDSDLTAPETLDEGVTRYVTIRAIVSGDDPEARVSVEFDPDFDGPNFAIDAPARSGRFRSFGRDFSTWQRAKAGCPY